MRTGQALGIAIALAVASPASAQADAPATYGPSSDWAVDYGEDYCRLLRSFSNGDKDITLAMERIQPGPTVRIMLLGDGIGTSRRAATFGYSFTPEREGREARILQARTADGGSIYNLGTVYMAKVSESATREAQRNLRGRYSREAEKAFGESIDGVLIDGGVSEPVWLETGELGAPLEALQVCADELVQSWGLDAERHRNLRRPVIPANELGGWLPAGTIPPSDLRLLAGSQNVVRLMIDASGMPKDCAIHFPSLDAAVNQKVCASLMEKARFEPARDVSNTPIDSYWMTELIFLAGPPRG